MNFVALAADYDGTLAEDGRVKVAGSQPRWRLSKKHVTFSGNTSAKRYEELSDVTKVPTDALAKVLLPKSALRSIAQNEWSSRPKKTGLGSRSMPRRPTAKPSVCPIIDTTVAD